MAERDYRCCAVVPTLDNPQTIRSVVETIRALIEDVIVIDDGSQAAGRDVCRALASDGLARVIHLPRNHGKGFAVRRGLEEASRIGASHVFQIDADGQHDLARIADFLAASIERPEAAFFASPVYDSTAPRSRRIARGITRFWVDLEVGRGRIEDALIGFRLFPLAAIDASSLRCDRMAYDVECAVLLARAGVPIENRGVAIRYLSAEAGGVSHFKVVRDTIHLSWLHARLCTIGATRWCFDRLAWVLLRRRFEADPPERVPTNSGPS